MADKKALTIKKRKKPRSPIVSGKEFRERQRKAKSAGHRGMEEFRDWQRRSEKAYRDLKYPKDVNTPQKRHDYDMKYMTPERGALESHLRIYKNEHRPLKKGGWHLL